MPSGLFALIALSVAAGSRLPTARSLKANAPSLRSAWLVTACATTAPVPESVPADARKRTLDRQFVAIALPALAQCAAEPLAGLVDTAWIGRLGSVAMGAAGVAVSAHYAAAKVFNDPLLRTSISLVASSDGTAEPAERDKAISAALVLSLAVGLLQAVFFVVFAGLMCRVMGAPASSPMRAEALSYLRIRSLGLPAASCWIVANGIFRGLGDTSTPLVWALVFSGLNFVLDPLFMFPLGMGAAGAAAGTALSQTAALFGLLHALRRKLGGGYRAGSNIGGGGGPAAGGSAGADAGGVAAGSAGAAAGRDASRGDDVLAFRRLFALANLATLGPVLLQYSRAGALVFARSWGKVAVYAFCSRAAAALGPVASAAHLLCFSLGVTLSQLSESIAIATQTMLARALGRLRTCIDAAADCTTTVSPGDADARAVQEARADAWHIISRACLAGGVVALALTGFTALRPRAIVGGLTTDPAVRAACHSILPPVLACQLFKSLAYPANGIIMGGLDWAFALVGLWLGSLGCILYIALGPSPSSLSRLWSGIAVFVAAQSLLVAARVLSRSGPWAMLWPGGEAARAGSSGLAHDGRRRAVEPVSTPPAAVQHE